MAKYPTPLNLPQTVPLEKTPYAARGHPDPLAVRVARGDKIEPDGSRANPHPLEGHGNPLNVPLLPASAPDISVAYAALQVELDQKIDIIKALHWSISRAKTFQPPDTLDDLRSKHSDALAMRDAQIIDINTAQTALRAEIARLEEHIKQHTHAAQQARHADAIQARNLHIESLKTEISTLRDQIEKDN